MLFQEVVDEIVGIGEVGILIWACQLVVFAFRIVDRARPHEVAAVLFGRSCPDVERSPFHTESEVYGFRFAVVYSHFVEILVRNQS